ncbi:MAG: nucleoside triphosphate pyrophosphatase [Pirellulales bacterium]
MSAHRLILASGSPRRRELLSRAGYRFDVMVPDASAECGVCTETGPAALVVESATRKAADVVARVEHAVVVACDTVAECQGRILGKPVDTDHAREMLAALSGREHRVYSGLCVWPVDRNTPSDPRTVAELRVAITSLRMDRLAEEQLAAYLASEAWEGKAGAFGYQDGLDWVHIVEGSESNVIGLPMEVLEEILTTLGIHPAERANQ